MNSRPTKAFPKNWSGHLIGHPLVGRSFRITDRESSSYTAGKVSAVIERGGRLMLHFEWATYWVPLDECEEWK